MYGLGGRAYDFKLQETEGEENEYTMFNRDTMFKPGDKGSLYGSIPYVLGVSERVASGTAWVNSAWTYVKIGHEYEDDGRSLVHFVSESDTIDFFIFANAK